MNDLPNLNYTLLTQGLSAFAGVFFAFIFLRLLADFLSRVHQQKVKHYNSLVLLETQLNELGGIIDDNLYLIPAFRKVISSGHIYFSKLRPLPIDRSHYDNLQDIGLKNDLFTYTYRLRKINDDIDSLDGGYSDIKNAYIRRYISQQEYLTNAQNTAELLKSLEAFLKDTVARTTRLQAKIRLMLKRDITIGTKILRWFIHTSGAILKKEDIEKEEEKLLKEIEETKSRSHEEIEEVLKKCRDKK